VHLEAVDSVLVDALRKIKISFRISAEKIGLYIRVGGLGSCRSSSTSTDRRLQPVRRNMLLRQHSASAASSEHACNIKLLQQSEVPRDFGTHVSGSQSDTRLMCMVDLNSEKPRQ
jgi:hypothetical protein